MQTNGENPTGRIDASFPFTIYIAVISTMTLTIIYPQTN
jgi:hypothetical protein